MKQKELCKIPDATNHHLSLRKMHSNLEAIASEPIKESIEKIHNDQNIVVVDTNTNVPITPSLNSPKKIFSVVKCPEALKQRCNSDFGPGLMDNYFKLDRGGQEMEEIEEESFLKSRLSK